MMDRTSEPRIFPVQVKQGYNRESGGVRESVYMAAYEVYCHVWAPQPAMVDLEGRGCRGGFGSGELIALLYARAFPKAEWRQRVDEAMKGMRGFA